MRKGILILLVIFLMSETGALADSVRLADASEISTAAPAALPSPEEVSDAEASEGADTFTLWFEEGFSLDLPVGWVSYAVDGDDAAAGVRYALGDGTGDHYLYIQITPTALDNFVALSDAVEEAGYIKTGNLTFGGLEFVTAIDNARNASCCCTLWNGELLTFVFTPLSDSSFILSASQLMETFNQM